MKVVSAILCVTAFTAIMGAITGCGVSDNDAEPDSRDTGRAKAVINMPNHFNNVAHKCYGNNGIYVSDHGNNGSDGANSAGGTVFVLANDPQCP